jgi:SSS family solute:Na+ symporter
MQAIQLQWIDYTVLIAYVIFVLGIGWALSRYMKTSADFLTSARSIPTWVTGLAFISANLGALELVGMAASGAKYGIATAHFYWVGAIPAMIFLAVFMMPFYYGSKARSVPEYLNMRFDGRVRCLNSIAFAVMTIFASGISMNALAKLLNQLLNWNYDLALWVCSIVVLLYVLKGGLTSAIYTEVLQFFMIVLGFAPVVYLGLKDVGWWHNMTQRLHLVAQDPAALNLQPAGTHYAADAWTSAWTPLLAGPAHNRGLVCDDFRPRLRVELRLLVHQLPCRAARDGGQKHECRPQHADCGVRSENAFPVPRHCSRHDRRGADLDAGKTLSHSAAGHFAGSLRQGGDGGESR